MHMISGIIQEINTIDIRVDFLAFAVHIVTNLHQQMNPLMFMMKRIL